jgi:hypothetical protein
MIPWALFECFEPNRYLGIDTKMCVAINMINLMCFLYFTKWLKKWGGVGGKFEMPSVPNHF